MPTKNAPKVLLDPTEGVEEVSLQVRSTLALTNEGVVLKPGIKVRVNNQHYRIRQMLDLETVLVEDSQAG